MQKKVLHEAEGRMMKNGCGYTGIKENEVNISTTSGRELRKDIWNIDNWECRGAQKDGWNLTFIVTEEDLE